jgi:hypothetical protein
MARAIVEHGGVPVIVSDRDWPLKAIFHSERDKRAVYQLTPQDLGLESSTSPATIPAPSRP